MGSFFNYLFLFHLLHNIPCWISVLCPNQWSVVCLISYHIEVFWAVVYFLFLFISFLRFCVVVSLSSSTIFGPTLCHPGMFGGVTLLLSCDLASEAFFAVELIMSDIFLALKILINVCMLGCLLPTFGGCRPML